MIRVMVVRVFVVLAVGLAVGGCQSTNMQWVKAGATHADFERDKLQCEYEAKAATPGRYSGRGLGNAIADGIADGMRLNELGTLCMRTKGYTLVAAGSNPVGVPAAPAERRNLGPADAVAEARARVAGAAKNPKFSGRYATVTSAMGDPTDVVCGSVNGKPFVYFVDLREATVVDGADADVNRGIYRSYCERAPAQS
jgi:hypothetical protein